MRGATLKLTQGLQLSRIVFVGRGALALAFLIGPVIADSVSPDGAIHTEIIPDLLDLYSVLLFLGVVVSPRAPAPASCRHDMRHARLLTICRSPSRAGALRTRRWSPCPL